MVPDRPKWEARGASNGRAVLRTNNGYRSTSAAPMLLGGRHLLAISSSGGGSSSAGASSSLPRPPRNTAAHAAPVRAPAAAHSERRERTLRSGDVTATSSALATSLSYKIRPDGKATVEGAGSAGPVRDFLGKLQLAWQIFFPDKPPELTPKDGAKQRLRMILVADRCGMSPSGLAEMKKNILSALEEFVDIESESQIDVSVSVEPDVGTIYCVAVPVKRVKPEAQMGFEDEVSVDGMRVVEWDPQDKESDPSSRFPMGC
ncbi:hypothetical protein MNEG_2230 [Monoraphidium neglectum]|uniref:Cell division topological specificity factor n=1 Tax=Monoraphidium neglectum TaxID=145388 RepID=A0A0D2NM65_9CHLO|nr:hypothetical protein MNEG_2230 [Monoraphidium neglectum]KIZ05726.1 hypothetical protein MNEG_2230 [Monoraphidium neglectum]|eukprot:XP_013904745.1 hypothetical protein MNEG_2230 [Monoraphidium neglectum]